MALRPLLARLADDPDGAALIADGGRAFVSQSMRPYLVAALAEGAAADRPTLVVAGDDRQARDLAADLRAWLEPRPVRFYPSRGVAYESHLAPPPHLVGLRVAALDALLAERARRRGAAGRRRQRGRAEREGPRPGAAPALLHASASATCSTSTRSATSSWPPATSASTRSTTAASSPIRGGILDLYPATEDRAVRIDLFDIEVESIRFFSTFTQRSLGETDAIEIAPAAELAPEHRELAEIAALEDAEDRPDVAELLPVDRFQAFLDLAADAAILIAAEEEVAPALADHWQDVCAAFHDDDAHHLYVKPDAIAAALDARASVRLSSISADQPIEFRAQAADLAARSLKEAEPELEKLVRSDYRTVVDVAAPRRRRARRLQPRAPARLVGRRRRRPAVRSRATLRDGFIAAGLQPRRHPRAPALPPPPRRAARSGRRAGAARCARSPTCAPATSSSTRTTASPASPASTRRPSPASPATTSSSSTPAPTASSCRSTSWRRSRRYVGAGGSHPPLCKLGGKAWETMKARARRAAQELAGELLNLYAERRRRPGHAFPEDGEWLREFEARFPYQETADQREAIEHVKADMERAQPMDRLICGDVGYGKTEVALRAAFKAADDGKQVLVLAPTTILAQQHFGTFSERLKDYPFTIEHVSRFRSRQGAEGGRRRLQRGPASTSSSAPTACSAATCAARTSG